VVLLFLYFFFFFDRKELKDLLSYIRLVLNPYDSNACLRILNVPRRGIGNTTRQQIMTIADEKGTDFFSAIESAVEENMLKAHKIKCLKEFHEIILDLIRCSRTSNIPDFMQMLIERSGYIKQFEEVESVESRASIEIVEELTMAANEYFDKEHGNLKDFADYLALHESDSSKNDEDNSNQEYVSLLTLHNAKGLEFPIVFIAGMDEGLCPYFRKGSDFSKADLEEERRLAYVGITRAEEKVILVSAKSRRIYGKEISTELSRFIDELPENYLEKQDIFREFQ